MCVAQVASRWFSVLRGYHQELGVVEPFWEASRGGGSGGRALVLSAAQIWFTDVAAFGLWFWELDRGGPHMRTTPEHPRPDFLFPRWTLASHRYEPGVRPARGLPLRRSLDLRPLDLRSTLTDGGHPL
jgi:hypothetical protein